jgi:hypothetical protein
VLSVVSLAGWPKEVLTCLRWRPNRLLQLPGRYDYVRAPVRLVSGLGTHRLLVSDIGSLVGKNAQGMP